MELDGESLTIRASIETIGGYSAHAGLINFIKRMLMPPCDVRLVRDESDAKRSLKTRIESWAAGAGHNIEVNLAGTGSA